MPEKYKIIGTTADVKLRVFGKDKEELFKNAALGMLAILKPNYAEKVVERKITVEADDEVNLLIDFLNELLYQMHVNKECYQAFELKFKNEIKLDAKLEGFELRGFGEEIKAATYCDLRIFKNEKGLLECEVVFDI